MSRATVPVWSPTEASPPQGGLATVEFSLILPTYNERDNLAPLFARLHAALAPHVHEVIVVDDDSPDETWKEAERLRNEYPQIRVIRRPGKRGLSSAVICGFRAAQGGALAVMDADLQHDENVLPQLIEGLKHAHFVVASRAVDGGGVGQWDWTRRLTSWVATALGRLVLNVTLSDPMSGFFAIRKELFAKLDDGTLHPQGFKVFLYLYLCACRRLGAGSIGIREVGFVFRDRLHGTSKLTYRVVWDYVRMLYEFRRTSPVPQGFSRFAAVGALGVVVNSSLLFWLHTRIGLSYLLAGTCAIELAILHNFLLNELWTFRNLRRGRSGMVWSRLTKFQLVSFGGMAINLATLALLHGVFNLPLLLSNLVGISGAVMSNYATNKLWTWKA
jgi:dolichol-phosphate mannosyltransferase